MFRSINTWKFAISNRAKLSKSEQLCIGCRKWFDNTTVIKSLLDTAHERQSRGETGVPVIFCACSHCCKSQIAIMPGKYDGLHAKHPSTQRYQFGERAR